MHAAAALDLPYIYSAQGILKEPNLAQESGQGLLGIISTYGQGDLGGVASNVMGFFKKAKSGDSKSMDTKTSPADVVIWGTTRSAETSSAVVTHATGAMSWAFITAMKRNSQQSYVQLLNSVRDVLAERYE